MREHADPIKESVTDPFLTPPEAFEKDQLDLYQRDENTRHRRRLGADVPRADVASAFTAI